MRKIIATVVVFLLAGACVVGAVALVQPDVLSVRPIAADSPCPVVGCASGECHGFDDVPEPDGARRHYAEGGTVMRMLVVDVLALALYIVVSLPALTGVGPHEWLGLGVGLVLLVHGVQHADFVTRLLSGHRSLRVAGRVLLDVALVIAVVVVVLSGLMESGAVLLSFGLYAEGYYFWGPLHATSAKVLLALLIVHGALNIGPVRRLMRHRCAKETE